MISPLPLCCCSAFSRPFATFPAGWPSTSWMASVATTGTLDGVWWHWILAPFFLLQYLSIFHFWFISLPSPFPRWGRLAPSDPPGWMMTQQTFNDLMTTPDAAFTNMNNIHTGTGQDWLAAHERRAVHGVCVRRHSAVYGGNELCMLWCRWKVYSTVRCKPLSGKRTYLVFGCFGVYASLAVSLASLCLYGLRTDILYGDGFVGLLLVVVGGLLLCCVCTYLLLACLCGGEDSCQ